MGWLGAGDGGPDHGSLSSLNMLLQHHTATSPSVDNLLGLPSCITLQQPYTHTRRGRGGAIFQQYDKWQRFN
jgi:hypothetical protein